MEPPPPREISKLQMLNREGNNQELAEQRRKVARKKQIWPKLVFLSVLWSEKYTAMVSKSFSKISSRFFFQQPRVENGCCSVAVFLHHICAGEKPHEYWLNVQAQRKTMVLSENEAWAWPSLCLYLAQGCPCAKLFTFLFPNDDIFFLRK